MRLNKKTILTSLLLFCGAISSLWLWFFNAYQIHIDWNIVRAGHPHVIILPNYTPSLMDDWPIAPGEPVHMYPRINNPAPRIKDYLQAGYQLRNNPPVYLNGPISWSQNPNNDRNWQFKVNSWDMLAPFINAYKIEQSQEHLEISESVILDWVNTNLIEKNDNAFKWHDMSTGLRAVQLGVLLQERLSQNEVQSDNLLKLIYAAELHAKVLRAPSLLNQGNHGLFQLVGLATLCKAVSGLPSCQASRSYVDENFATLMAKQFSDEGVHLEHSSQYHPWAIQVLNSIQALELLDERNFEVLELAKKNTKWYFQPDGQLGLLGDSDRKPVRQYRHLHPHMAFLDNNNAGEEPLDQYQIFYNTGLAFYRSHWRAEMADTTSYLAVAAGYHSKAHKQRDDLSFEWFEKGIPVLTDSGKYSYDKSDMRRFVQSRFAHNTVTVDDEKSRFFTTPRPYGSAIEAGGKAGEIFWVYMTMDREDMDVRHSRLLALLPGQWLLVADDLLAEEEKTYRQWFQFSPEFELQQSDDALWIERDGDRFLNIYSLSGNKDIASFYGQKSPELRGWISEDYRTAEPRGSISFTQRAKTHGFVTLFSFGETPLIAEPVIFNSSGKSSLCWRNDGSYHGVVFDQESKTIGHCGALK